MTINLFPAKLLPIMNETYAEKTDEIKKKFFPLSLEQRYHLLIELGRALPFFTSECKTSEHLVSGCQSSLYLRVEVKEHKLYFSAYSEALISAGLAALLIWAYNGETAETILKTPPDFLSELDLAGSLSPNRSNGLSAIHLRMKQLALKSLLSS